MSLILGIRRKADSQVDMLRKSFNIDPYPGYEEKLQLAKMLNMSQKHIENWFGGMRRTKSIEGVLKRSE